MWAPNKQLQRTVTRRRGNGEYWRRIFAGFLPH
jgi:hypothetical protein